ncbi:MAG: hypothetical protein IKE02_00730 [Lachnospiraceae bacterium]|nr:hypothetical protein [Lachnospiraceae bacterium]
MRGVKGSGTMKYDKPVLYNLLLPFWVLIFVPSWLWLILIPLNYLLDRIVLRWSLGDMPDRGLFCRRHTWKLCLVGFMGDIVGAVFMVAALFLTALPGALHEKTAHPLLDKITYGVGFNPFSNILSFVIVLAAIFLAGLIIYLIDKALLIKVGLSLEQAKKSALRIALITAPYLFLFPSSILYEGSEFIL